MVNRDAWEELKWQCVQEFVRIVRELLLQIRDESPSFDKIWVFCNAPGEDGFP